MAFDKRALRVNQEYYNRHTAEVKELISKGLNNEINEQFKTKQIKYEPPQIASEEAIETDKDILPRGGQFFDDESFESGEMSDLSVSFNQYKSFSLGHLNELKDIHLYNTVCNGHTNKLKIPLNDAVRKILDGVSKDDSFVKKAPEVYESSVQSMSMIAPSSNSSGNTREDNLQREKCACVPILVVDDNEFNVILLQEILYTYKLQSDAANDGKEACEMVKKSFGCCPYRLVFMDINMPIMDGFEATVRIRELCQQMVD